MTAGSGPVTLDAVFAPYLLWAKTRHSAALDLAGSNLLHCSIDDLPDARAIDLWVANDDGYRPLVDAVARHYGITADRVVMAAGCSGANFIAIAALVGSGDDVLIERPTYDPLIGACRLMGASVRRFERRFEDAYALDVDAIRSALTPRTRLIVVTTPHNPSGIMADARALRAIGELAARAGAHVLVDEVYLDGAKLLAPDTPIASAAHVDGPFVVTSSLTKSYGLAGLRCGWIVADAEIADRLRRTRDVVDSISSAPSDQLSTIAFAALPALSRRAYAILSRNIASARQFFSDHPGVEIAAPPSASICFPRLKGIGDAGVFVDRLIAQHGVAVAPGRFFESPAHFRLSLAGHPETLEAGLAKLAAALRDAGVA